MTKVLNNLIDNPVCWMPNEVNFSKRGKNAYLNSSSATTIAGPALFCLSLCADLNMPAKSLKATVPLQQQEEEPYDSDNSEWNLTSESAGDGSPAALFFDPALSTSQELLEIPDVGDFETQVPLELPNVHPQLETAEEDITDTAIPYQTSDIAKYVLYKDKKVLVTELQWDKANTMGQIRTLQQPLVKHYVRSLKKSPPRKLIRILAKATTGLFV